VWDYQDVQLLANATLKIVPKRLNSDTLTLSKIVFVLGAPGLALHYMPAQVVHAFYFGITQVSGYSHYFI
jgi:hypothetical protein